MHYKGKILNTRIYTIKEDKRKKSLQWWNLLYYLKIEMVANKTSPRSDKTKILP